MIPPEIQKMFDDLRAEFQREKEAMQSEITALTERLNQFQNAPEISPDVKRSLGLIISSASGKAATDEDVSINEAGVATHTVLGSPDKFIKIGDANVPAWNS